MLAASALIATAAAVASTGSAAATTPPALGPPQSVVTPDGHIQVFAIGSGLIWQNWQNPSTGAHGNWVAQPSPISFVGTVSLVPRAGTCFAAGVPRERYKSGLIDFAVDQHPLGETSGGGGEQVKS